MHRLPSNHCRLRETDPGFEFPTSQTPWEALCAEIQRHRLPSNQPRPRQTASKFEFPTSENPLGSPFRGNPGVSVAYQPFSFARNGPQIRVPSIELPLIASEVVTVCRLPGNVLLTRLHANQPTDKLIQFCKILLSVEGIRTDIMVASGDWDMNVRMNVWEHCATIWTRSWWRNEMKRWVPASSYCFSLSICGDSLRFLLLSSSISCCVDIHTLRSFHFCVNI